MRVLPVSVRADCVATPAGSLPIPIVAAQSNIYASQSTYVFVRNASEFPDGTEFGFDFGDASTPEVSRAPSHRFPVHDNPMAMDASYLVKVTARLHSQESVGSATVRVVNEYAIGRRRGVATLPVTNVPDFVDTLVENPQLTFSIHNPEDQPVRFSQRVVEIESCGDSSGPSRHVEAVTLDVPGSGDVAVQAAVPASGTPAICQVNVTYVGVTAGGLPAFAGAYAVTRNALVTHPVADPAVTALLNSVSADDLAGADRITSEDLLRLQLEGRLPAVSSSPVSVLAPSPGDECDPVSAGQSPPAPDYSCQPTEEWKVAAGGDTAGILNARPGDLVLSGGCNQVYDMISHLSPPQHFVHAGMMIPLPGRNEHSTLGTVTFSMGWLIDHGIGLSGSNGFQTGAMRYGFPGGVFDVPVSDAFFGRGYDDVQARKTYGVADWVPSVRCERSIASTPSVVWKPHVLDEASVRPRLRFAANDYADLAGHYRFFAYSDATVALDPGRFSPPNQANDRMSESPGIMCSSAAWLALRDHFTLEGSGTEPTDDVDSLVANGAAVPDGLYPYTPAERFVASTALYESVWNTVRQESEGWWGEVLTHAADDIAGQMTSCLLSDDCESDGSWWGTLVRDLGLPNFYGSTAFLERAGWGQTVSPEQVLNWDSASAGGPYGQLERMVYRSTVFTRKYTWQPSGGRGDVQGTLVTPDARGLGPSVPVGAGVPVVLRGSTETFTTVTQPDGTFTFAGVPGGNVQLTAEYSLVSDDPRVPATPLVADSVFVVANGSVTTVELVLGGSPSAGQARLRLFLSVDVKDDEGAGSNHFYDLDHEYFCDVDLRADTSSVTDVCTLFGPNPDIYYQACAGGEVTTRLWVNAVVTAVDATPLATPTRMRIDVHGTLWEYGHILHSCNEPSDQADDQTQRINVLFGDEIIQEMDLSNGNADYARYTLRWSFGPP